MKYHELPKNYATKAGFRYMNSSNHENVVYDKYNIVGGDTHCNDGSLSKYGIKNNVNLKECDIYDEKHSCKDKERGEIRLVYTTNVKKPRVFFAKEYKDSNNKVRYEIKYELTRFKLQLTSNICWIIFSVYVTGVASFFIARYYYNRNNDNYNVIS